MVRFRFHILLVTLCGILGFHVPATALSWKVVHVPGNLSFLASDASALTVKKQTAAAGSTFVHTLRSLPPFPNFTGNTLAIRASADPADLEDHFEGAEDEGALPNRYVESWAVPVKAPNRLFAGSNQISPLFSSAAASVQSTAPHGIFPHAAFRNPPPGNRLDPLYILHTSFLI